MAIRAAQNKRPDGMTKTPRPSSWIKKRAPGFLSIISQVYWENHMGGGPAKLYSAVGRQRGVLDVCALHSQCPIAEKQSSRDYSCTMVHGERCNKGPRSDGAGALSHESHTPNSMPRGMRESQLTSSVSILHPVPLRQPGEQSGFCGYLPGTTSTV